MAAHQLLNSHSCAVPLTQGVRVHAAPLFIPELTQLSQGERQYFFAYR